jgi:hypothetical protein
VVAPQEFAQNSDRLTALWKAYESGVWALGDPRIRLSGNEHSDVEVQRIQATGNLSRVSHLRVQQSGVGETINEDADRPFACCVYDTSAATSLGLQLNAPILFEGLAVETSCDTRNLVTFEIPPGGFLRAPKALAELVWSLDH